MLNVRVVKNLNDAVEFLRSLLTHLHESYKEKENLSPHILQKIFSNQELEELQNQEFKRILATFEEDIIKAKDEGKN